MRSSGFSVRSSGLGFRVRSSRLGESRPSLFWEREGGGGVLHSLHGPPGPPISHTEVRKEA